MNLGIRLHDTAGSTLEEHLKSAREQGFSCVHIALSKTIPGFSMKDAPALLTDSLAAEVRALLDKYHMECAVLGCYLNLATPDEGELAHTVECYKTPLVCPRGAAGFTLACLLAPEERPALREPAPAPAEAYRCFLAQQASAAVLTTGQVTALEGVAASGKGFAYRVLTPSEVITDQVWLGSLFPGAGEDAASLLAHLIAPAAQKRLASQGLYTVREDLKLYASGVPGLMERAAARSLTAISAYIDPDEVNSAAWQVLSGREGLSAALMPLL